MVSSCSEAVFDLGALHKSRLNSATAPISLTMLWIKAGLNGVCLRFPAPGIFR